MLLTSLFRLTLISHTPVHTAVSLPTVSALVALDQSFQNIFSTNLRICQSRYPGIGVGLRLAHLVYGSIVIVHALALVLQKRRQYLRVFAYICREFFKFDNSILDAHFLPRFFVTCAITCCIRAAGPGEVLRCFAASIASRVRCYRKDGEKVVECNCATRAGIACKHGMAAVSLHIAMAAQRGH